MRLRAIVVKEDMSDGSKVYNIELGIAGHEYYARDYTCTTEEEAEDKAAKLNDLLKDMDDLL